MRVSRIIYNPNLSVEENAEKNSVSQAAIRYYIKVNHIDRRAEEKIKIISACRRYFSSHPEASKSEVARATKYGLSSVRKYWEYIVSDKEFVDFDRNKAKDRQCKDLPNPKNPSGRKELWSAVLKDIPELFRQAESEDVRGLSKFLKEKPEMPMLFVGSGGIQGDFPALLYEIGLGIGKAVTPYSFSSISDNALKHSRILLMSEDGMDDDIVYASRRAVETNPGNTACLTFSEDKNNRMLKVFAGTSVRKFIFSHPLLKDGFIAVRDKFFRNGILYRAFTGRKGMLSGLNVDLSSDKCFHYRLNREGFDLPDFRRINHFLVLYGSYGEPVAADFESLLVKSGLASVQICDYRTFCHGRFIFASNHTMNFKEPRGISDAAMVLLVTPRERKIASDMLKCVIPVRMPIVSIETDYDSPLATFDLMIKANVLAGEIGEKYYGVNLCSPNNYSGIDKRIPINGIKFVTDLTRFGNLTLKEPDRSKEFELKQRIDEYVGVEHQNTLKLAQAGLPQQRICKADILKEEQYDAAKSLCYAFRKKEDLHKDAYIPFGNMNGGFPFKIHGIMFNQSEGAYISGMFSCNTPEHIAIQRELAAAKSGMAAKKEIRHKYQSSARDDWNDFNVEWMLYCVWMKCKGNRKFRNLLLSVPREAIIIEDVSFKPRKKNDTANFWGCRNPEIKAFNDLVEDYVKLSLKNRSAAEQLKVISAYRNDFCNYGVFEGTNAMGKILMLCKQCLHENTEPDIDYEQLRSKNIYICGNRLTFDK